jgi:hypothetical protein
MEKLEDFIKKNRDDLDIYSPSPGLWKRIRKHSYKNWKYQVYRLTAVAAIITVILGTATLFFKETNHGSLLHFGRNSDALIMKANPVLSETEIYYNTLVKNLYDQASPMLTGHPGMEKELLTDLSQLDSIYVEIKRDLRDNVSNQEVVEALISNYRTKIGILEEMLTILKDNETDNKKTETHAL